MIFKTRKTYQNFIQCVVFENQRAFAIDFSFNKKNVFEKNFFENVVEKNFLKHDRIAVEKSVMKINVMKKVLFVVVNSNFVDFEFNFASMIFVFQSIASITKTKRKIKRDRKSKNDKFVVFFSFFNVYIDFHLINNVRKYATIINFNVFVEKMKHM